MDVVQRFLKIAATFPDKPAIASREGAVTYRRLLDRTRAFAARFSRYNHDRVLIGLPQSPDAYAAILATGLAGGCYTPLNLAAPLEKLRKVAKALEPHLIVASGDLARKLSEEAPAAAVIDPSDLDEGADYADTNQRHHLAYILFTSGSTGTPKGVMVPRHGLEHYVDWLETFNIGPNDRVSQQPNLAFDISVTDIYGALCFGASLHPPFDEGDRLMPARMIAREGITVWNSVPSVVSLMTQAGQLTQSHLHTVRLFNFIGEPLLPEQVSSLFSVRPDARIQNTYGPTEATVSMTCLELDFKSMPDVGAPSVPLGDPIPSMAIHLVGGAHDDEGEIVISGPQVADGYWRDPERTAAAFKAVSREGGASRAYYTGDWAERRDGQLYFKERIDFQVKVRGFRVELDEVAAAVRACGWPVVCVFKRQNALAAVVEHVHGRQFRATDLRTALSKLIEQHAIPEIIREIQRMPRNDNDKLDRKAAALWLEEHLLGNVQ